MSSMAQRSVFLAAAVFAFAGVARAATPGFVEDFASGIGGFGGSATETHVTSGGVGGAGDPFLEVTKSPTAPQLGTFSQAPDLTGNLPADGVTGYSFWLRDTGADDNLEIHVGVGIPFVNFWQSLPGFAPPTGSWQQFSVDLTQPNQWVRIIGSGTFAAALAGSTNLLFRHDFAPYMQDPDPVTAGTGFGLDRIQVLPVPAELPAVSGSGRAALALLLVAMAAVAARGFRGARSAA